MATGPFGSAVSSKHFQGSGIPLIRGTNLSRDVGTRLLDNEMVYLSKEKAAEFARSMAVVGDLVFTCWGTIGQVGLIDKRSRFDQYIVSNKQMKLTPDESKVDSLYLYYALSAPTTIRTMEAIAIGSSVPGFNLGQLREIQVPLPPLSIQRAIASVLGALDDKIHSIEHTRRCADALLKAFFEQTAGPALAHEAEDTPLPDGWRRERLASVIRTLETGKRPRGGVSAYSTGIPSLGAESIVGLAVFDFNKTKFVPVEYFEGMQRGIAQDMDVLLYKDGGRPGEFEPHVALLGNGFPFARFCINEHVYRLRALEPLSQEFLYYWLSSESILEEMRRRGTGVAIPGLNSAAVKGLPIDLPPSTVIERFTAVARPLVTFVLHGASQARALSQLRDALLPKLLSAELRVRDAEVFVGAAV